MKLFLFPNGAVVVLECEKQLKLRMTETSQNMSGVCDGIIMFIMSSTFSQKGRKFPNMKAEGCVPSPGALF